jgi:hypothetical protein
MLLPQIKSKAMSSLSVADFRKRLTQLTSREKDLYFITPYNSSGTPFCGTHDNKSFSITRNSFWRHVKGIEIIGEYKALNINSTEVFYKIGIAKYLKNLSVAIFILLFIALNTVLFIKSNTNIVDILKINGFLIFSFSFAIAINWITMRIVNQRFKEEFEIDIENEWEKLAVKSS